jgi:hypothetical protein
MKSRKCLGLLSVLPRPCLRLRIFSAIFSALFGVWDAAKADLLVRRIHKADTFGFRCPTHVRYIVDIVDMST